MIFHKVWGKNPGKAGSDREIMKFKKYQHVLTYDVYNNILLIEENPTLHLLVFFSYFQVSNKLPYLLPKILKFFWKNLISQLLKFGTAKFAVTQTKFSTKPTAVKWK